MGSKWPFFEADCLLDAYFYCGHNRFGLVDWVIKEWRYTGDALGD